MNDTLTDPNKPAHAIIKVHDDGSTLRNDGVALQAANSNPWYVLATVFGEQEEGATWFVFDKELAAQNRRAWNGWFCAELNEDERKDQAEKIGLDADDLKPLTKAELAKITRLFKNRMGKTAKLPDRTENINFSMVYFSKFLCFEKYTFEKGADFSSSTFRSDADFSSATFRSDADFRSSTFRSYADFSSSTFRSGADFSSATFRSYAYFSSSTFRSDVNFRSATFRSVADFSSAKFKSTTRFDMAQFLSAVPVFHGAELYDDTTFTLPDNYRDNWPPLSGQVTVEGQDKPIDVMPAADQKRAYNRLRLFMNQALQIDEEQFFHRQEMRCKRETSDGFHRAIYTLFEELSDYGNSVLRPVVWLFYVWIWGAIAKLKAVGDGNMMPDYHSIPHALGWSLSNLFTVFGFWRLYFEEFKTLDAVLQVIGSMQTVSGFVLLFLLGLGLRNRFRLR